jgi:ATP-dependent exoDNAse (exonuclease V) beta subunit
MTVPDVSIISASAGTGKTHKLMQLVIQTISSGQFSPESILLTTFTEKAAAELRERVCSELVKINLIPEARRFNFARMGTINSICMKLLKDFSFEIGLSPNCQVLDEQTSIFMLKESVFATASADDLLALNRYEEKFSFNDGRFGSSKFDSEWLKAVLRLISAARYNRIQPSGFVNFAKRSTDELFRFYPAVTKTAAEIDRGVLNEYSMLASSIDVGLLKTKAEKEFFRELQKQMSQFDNTESFAWKHKKARFLSSTYGCLLTV